MYLAVFTDCATEDEAEPDKHASISIMIESVQENVNDFFKSLGTGEKVITVTPQVTETLNRNGFIETRYTVTVVLKIAG